MLWNSALRPNLVQFTSSLSRLPWRRAQLLHCGVEADVVLRNVRLRQPWSGALRQLRDFIGPNAGSYNAVMARGTWILNLELSRHMSRSLVERDVISYNSLTARAKSWVQSLGFVKQCQIGAIELNQVSLNSAIAALEASTWRRSIQIFSGQLRHDIISYTACLTSTQWLMALSLSQQMSARHLKWNLVARNALLSRMAWLRATSLLPQKPDDVSFNTVISCAAEAAEWMEAIDLGRIMASQAVEADEITSGALATACDRAFLWPNGLRLVNVVCYASAMSLCKRLERWLDCNQLMLDMELKLLEANVLSYSAAMSTYAASTAWHRAVGLLKQLQSGIRMDLILQSSLIDVFQQANLWRCALHWLPEPNATQVPT